MNISDLMKENGIERIVYVRAPGVTGLLRSDCFHAWRFDNTMQCGVGATVEEAIENAGKLERLAA